MKFVSSVGKRAKFDVLAMTRDAQAAMMTLRRGATSDSEVGNEHPRSEQWLFVLSGTGRARIGRKHSALRTIQIRANSLLVIEKGELHQIKNTGRSPLRTINFYVPPAYNMSGDLKEE